MRQTAILVFILIIIGIIAGFVYFQSSQNSSQNLTIIPTPISSMMPSDLLQGGGSFADPNGVYTFLYPSDYTLDTQDPLHPRIYKTGPTQTGQTEMYDGVILVFENVDLSSTTLSQWVDNRIKESTMDGTLEITQPKTTTNLNNYSGFSYSARGLGEANYIVLQKDSNSKNAVLITYSVMDPENIGFQEQVNSILSTLQILK